MKIERRWGTGRIAVLLVLTTHCATPGPGSGPASAAGPSPAGIVRRPAQLRPPSVLTADFVWRQRVTVQYADRPARSFDAVLQKRGETMSLVGLTPINTVTFIVEQRDMAVTFDNRTGQTLPFDGRYILQDVQRVYFPWLVGPTEDGVRSGAMLGESVSERLVAGRVVERRFERDGFPPVIVTLEGGSAGNPPERAVLDNPRYRYRLSIETQP